MRIVRWLFPDPPRAIPRHRALGIALRTAHILAFGTLLGGHVHGVAPERLAPFFLATAVTGLGLVALELASTCAWLFTGAGLGVLLKLAILLAVPAFPEHRVALLVLVVVVASVSAHMPSRFRHRAVLRIGLAGGDGATRAGAAARTRATGGSG